LLCVANTLPLTPHPEYEGIIRLILFNFRLACIGFFLDTAHFIFEFLLCGVGGRGDDLVIDIRFFDDAVLIFLGFGLPSINSFYALVKVIHTFGVDGRYRRFLSAVGRLPLAVHQATGMGTVDG
jgi:hypothetical protein